MFGAFWVLYRRHPPRLSENGRGQFYPVAIHQVFTGLYFMQLSLAGLFFLIRDSSGGRACTGQASLMIVIVISTGLFQSSMDYRGRLCWKPSYALIKRRDLLPDKSQPERPTKSRLQILDSGPDIDECARVGHIIWLPQDRLGIAANEIQHMKHSRHLAASTNGAYLDRCGRIMLKSGPPDWNG